MLRAKRREAAREVGAADVLGEALELGLEAPPALRRPGGQRLDVPDGFRAAARDLARECRRTAHEPVGGNDLVDQAPGLQRLGIDERRGVEELRRMRWRE